jgi:16S rRNA (guanine527-N7)-methyltransferase
MSEDSLRRSKPRPNVSNNSSANTENVGAGLAPALHTDTHNVGTGLVPVLRSPVLHPSSVHANPALQSSQANPTFQPSPAHVNSDLQPFLEGLHQYGLELTQQQSDQFLRYRQELLDWNTRINLTAINDPDEILLKHFLDSLSLLKAYEAPHARVLDIGAGAGFPGLPLKILRPQWHVVLLEATGKKVKFLQHIIDTLQLKDVEAVHGRAEELAHRAEYRSSFDMVTARAVASLPALLEYAAPFCRLGGQMIFPKKGNIAKELARGRCAASQLGARFKADIPVTLPGLDDGRRLLVWEQVSKCLVQYPRNAGVMTRKPLG